MTAKKKIMKVAIYARTSLENVQSPDMQLRELREYCERRRWKIFREYVDEGESSKNEKRPQLNQLMCDAHACRFNVVLVWRFDRFARSISHLIRALDTFNALGIEFISLYEQMDTTTPIGRLTFTILGAMAELERSLISERVKAGLRNAQANGKQIGRPKAVVDAREIAELRAEGLTWKEVSERLGVSLTTGWRSGIDVTQIISLRKAGWSWQKIAAKFSVARGTLRKLCGDLK